MSNIDSYFAARDPLGIKALYYVKTSSGYKFSSSVSELLNLQNVPKKPNIDAMKSMLKSREVAYEETMYDGIFRVPPGYFIRIQNDKLEHIRYWYPEKIKRNYNISSSEASKKLHDLLSKAVDKRIDTLKQSAFEVSGGLDSSSIVSLLAQKVDASNIESYSMQLHGLKCDESEYVDSIIEKYSISHKKVSCEKLDYYKKYRLSELYAISSDWPIIVTSANGLEMFYRMQLDKKNLIITGQGGDELFGRNEYGFYELFIRGQFITLYKELKFITKPFHAIKRYLVKPFLGVKILYFLKKILKKEKFDSINLRYKILNFTDKIGVSNLALKRDIDNISSVQHITVADSNFLHPIESNFNVEFRHPFYDLELVEFSLSLPPKFKYTEGKSKWILRKAMKGILPEMILYRKDKAEFSEIVIQQIEAINVNRLLDNAFIVKLGIVNQEDINAIRKRYDEQKVKRPYHIWGLINLEYWYRFNFEKESLEDIDKKETV